VRVDPELDILNSLHYNDSVRKKKEDGYMQSVITSKFQTTIPKGIRVNLGLNVKDALEWKVEKGRVVLYPAKRNFLKYRNAVKTGKGDIAGDIEVARSLRMEKHR
jgi:AbrB family looped-hinge helix DNA binding protein